MEAKKSMSWKEIPHARICYDVGGCDGTDTANYLALGYDVVCIEASPNLATGLEQRFAREIEAGRCSVLRVGVGNREGTLPFHLSLNPLWHSFDREMAARAGEVETIHIPVRKLADVISEFGQPEFVKIDVEGADFDCLQSLAASDQRPHFLSCEADSDRGGEMILILIGMGYTQFNLVRQDSHTHARLPVPGTLAAVKWSLRQWLRIQLRRTAWLHGKLAALRRATKASSAIADAGSGPPPREHRGAWYSAPEFMWLWQSVVYSGLAGSTWWDIHATRDPSPPQIDKDLAG